MLDLTPTSCKVNDLFMRESLAKAERYHELTLNAAPDGRQPIAKVTIQVPRISLFRRLRHVTLRPA